MSRIGKKPVPVPQEVTVQIAGQTITVEGPNGQLRQGIHPNISVSYDEEAREIRVTRPNEHRRNRALHGLTRSLINNMVRGVVQHFEKRLEIVGVGYNGIVNNGRLELQVGFANTVRLPIPETVFCEMPDNTHIVVKGADKQAVGQFAAEIRSVRPPEPYKGKGIRYQDEYIRRKAGKAFASG